MTSEIVITTDSNLDSSWDYDKLITKSTDFNNVILTVAESAFDTTSRCNRTILKIIGVNTAENKKFKIVFECSHVADADTYTIKYTFTSPNKVDIIKSSQTYTSYNDVVTDLDYILTQITALKPETT